MKRIKYFWKEISLLSIKISLIVENDKSIRLTNIKNTIYGWSSLKLLDKGETLLFFLGSKLLDFPL